MKVFLTKSLPALALIFVFVFGFAAIALGNACGYLKAVAEEATNYAWTACNTYGSNSNECIQAQNDAFACWSAYWNAGCN